MLGGGRFEGEAPPGFAGVLMLDLEIDLERQVGRVEARG